MENKKIDEMPNVEDLDDIVRPYVGYKLNGQVTLYQTQVWKTYEDKEMGEGLIINLLDIKYMKSYLDKVEVLDDSLPTEHRKYIIYVKVDQAVTDEIKVSESIYKQIERDLEMGE